MTDIYESNIISELIALANYSGLFSTPHNYSAAIEFIANQRQLFLSQLWIYMAAF